MSITVSAAPSPLASYRSIGPMPLQPGQSAFQAASIGALRRPAGDPAIEAPGAKPAEPGVAHTTRSPELVEMFDFMLQQHMQQQCQKSPLDEHKSDGIAVELAQDKVSEQRNYASHPHLMLAV
ncbi:hypothetical protein [Rhizobacter sp. OV335]|uniref:hypothetical protein n=1 Tax=Rhizobacter sp. OV335 TaxID=1500264 RepID=UPI000917AEB8|nr:hypothetical protein [Rhizobacter sp. OV335]SHM24278.1 hypothetical protein SAMN02787076_00813 [Rhizobacter sp. OV335]